MDVNGKKAVVFGGTSGIGRATAAMLAQKGAQVTAVSRDPSKAGAMPDGVTVKGCDVRDGAAVDALLKEIGPYDILISSATGGSRAAGPFLSMDMDGYKGSFDKLWGYANVVRYGAHYLNEGGSITLVSGAPARMCKPGQVALSSVGGAVEALARAVAKEIAPARRINVVSPGTIDTPMFAALPNKEEAVKGMVAGNLIERTGTADEVARGILFVVENDFVTGTTVDVDGGWLLS